MVWEGEVEYSWWGRGRKGERKGEKERERERRRMGRKEECVGRECRNVRGIAKKGGERKKKEGGRIKEVGGAKRDKGYGQLRGNIK